MNPKLPRETEEDNQSAIFNTLSEATPRRKRRPRYAGKYPRQFEEKYKERDPARHRDTFKKVLASGKTPAGTHRAIMVSEILALFEPKPGQFAIDCTLGYGGHAEQILPRLLPGGRLVGLDADPLELPKTEKRLRGLGFDSDVLTLIRSNFAGLAKALASAGLTGADLILADLGVSSMQLDDPARGFSTKFAGPLDMRMNPNRGEPASALLKRIGPERLAVLLAENSDEPRAALLGTALAGKHFQTTLELTGAIRATLADRPKDEQDLTLRRVFQGLRIAVNEESSALDSLLRQLPDCLNPGGRVVILTFHSGEDRRVKAAFAQGLKQGQYSQIAREVTRPSAEERHANPRSSSAKLRWARKSD